MKPPPFKYARVETAEHAVALLSEHGDDAKLLAGGQSLIPLMNMRLARPEVLIDIGRVSALNGVTSNGSLRIGATTRQAEVMRNTEVMRYAPIIGAALRHVGHSGVRARGTFGGSAAHADPAAEIPAVLVALDAEISVRAGGEEHSIAAEEFFVSTFETSLEDTEMLTAISFPYPTTDAVWSFHEVARRHGDFALVGVAAIAELGDDGTVKRARVALSGVAETPVRVREAEEALVGRSLAGAAEEAAAAAERQLDPPTDFHASEQYRRRVARALVARAINEMSTQGAQR